MLKAPLFHHIAEEDTPSPDHTHGLESAGTCIWYGFHVPIQKCQNQLPQTNLPVPAEKLLVDLAVAEPLCSLDMSIGLQGQWPIGEPFGLQAGSEGSQTTNGRLHGGFTASGLSPLQAYDPLVVLG